MPPALAAAPNGMLAPEAPAGQVLARLRTETRAEHDAIEAVLDLTAGTLTRERYVAVLARFHGFYRPLEAALAGLDGWGAIGIDLEARRKTPLLEADLRLLGRQDATRLPPCAELPALDGMIEALGCLYVIEGATLGGQVIARHVRRSLDIGPRSGGRFFHGYGERTGAMWRALRAAIVAAEPPPQAQDRMIASAAATFRALRQWCSRPAPA